MSGGFAVWSLFGGFTDDQAEPFLTPAKENDANLGDLAGVFDWACRLILKQSVGTS